MLAAIALECARSDELRPQVRKECRHSPGTILVAGGSDDIGSRVPEVALYPGYFGLGDLIDHLLALGSER